MTTPEINCGCPCQSCKDGIHCKTVYPPQFDCNLTGQPPQPEPVEP